MQTTILLTLPEKIKMKRTKETVSCLCIRDIFVFHGCPDVPVIHIGGQDHIVHDPEMISDEEEYVFNYLPKIFCLLVL